MQTIRIPSSPKSQAAQATEPSNRHIYDLLLQIEAEARRVDSLGELKFLIANESLKLTGARQIFVLARRHGPFRIETVSSIGAVDANSPRIRFIEGVVSQLGTEVGLATPHEFNLPAYCPPDSEEEKSFPFRFMAWVPLRLRDGDAFAGMLLVREHPWTEQDLVLSKRLANTYEHAWTALAGNGRLKRRFPVKPVMAATVIAAVAAGFYPVPMTVLAPTEVAAVEPHIIAAPIDGVIDAILVEPNQEIRQGQPLFRLSDTTLRNEQAVAEQDVKVAEARLMQVTQRAVSDAEARAELAIARSELQVAIAKRNYAADMLRRTEIVAPAAGVVVFTDQRDWLGRPVSTGERVMELADPAQVQLRIDVPVADVIAVKTGAPVRAFLDSDPLHPISAFLKSASFEAQMIEGNVLAYRLYATIDPPETALRLGIRGTSQISGDNVPLAFYLFRRPIAAIRQWLGL